MLFLFILLLPLNVLAKDTSKSSIVVDVDSGRILYKNNINEKRLIASTTKIMTFIIAVDNLKLNKEIKVKDEVNKSYGSNAYIKEGEKLTVEELLYGLMLRSGNDCALTLSKNIKDFIPKMNKKAKEIGMINTSFENVTGLDDYEEKNYSTALDMSKLSRYAYKNYKIYRKITSTKKYILKKENKTSIWYNRNKMLNEYKYLVSGKTGYTPKAGRTLVTVAKKNNLTLTMVSLKDPNHYSSQKELYEYLFNKYHKEEIINKRTFKIDKFFFNKNIYIKESFSYPLTKEEEKHIKIIVSINKTKNKGQIGHIKIKLYNNTIKVINIYLRPKKKSSRLFKLFTSKSKEINRRSSIKSKTIFISTNTTRYI